MSDVIFHITSVAAWDEACIAGAYRAASLAAEGFIHCSTQAQVLPVAEKFYSGQGDLVLLSIDPRRLTSALKWEPPSGGSPPPGVAAGETFPHVYGPINLEAVIQVLAFDASPNGHFSWPAAR